MPFSRESSQSRDQTHVSYVFCIDSWVLYHYLHLGSPIGLMLPIIVIVCLACYTTCMKRHIMGDIVEFSLYLWKDHPTAPLIGPLESSKT